MPACTRWAWPTCAKPKTCDFRSGRIILQQEILPDQMAKLLNEGKTDLLPGFVSQRTRRPFKAYLVRGKDGKISFEFEERKAKPGAKGAAPKGKAAAGADEAEGGDVAVATKPAAKKAAAKSATKTAAKTTAKTATKTATKSATKTVAAKKAPAKRAASTVK
jgi:DNA topoisomerase-3